MSSHPFITNTVTAIARETVITEKINCVYMVGVATNGSMAINTIRKVGTIEEFDTLVGNTAGARASFKFLRSIDASVPVYFVNGRSASGTPTLADNLVAGMLLLGLNVRMKPGIVICPESQGLSDKVLVFTAAQNLVSNSLLNWQYFHNLSLEANTKLKAIAERDLLSSSAGHSSLFWGFGKDTDGNQIPLATVAAARMMYLNRNRVGYFSPSAYQENLPFVSVDEVFLPKWSIGVDEYTELNNKNINTIFLDGDGITTGNYRICGARSLSDNPAWKHINTRYAANDIFYRCSEILKPYLFLPSDVNNQAAIANANNFRDTIDNIDIIQALRVLLDGINAEGAFSSPLIGEDGVLDDPYTIAPVKMPDGNLQITISMTLVQTREKIDINFVKRG